MKIFSKSPKGYFLFCCIGISIIYLLYLLSIKDSLLANSDSAYLVNRASQMLSCIKEGNIPFFYYKDFKGVGYGSSFFYGHLTLYPFLPFLLSDEITFLFVYICVAYIVNFIGAYMLARRLTKNYKFVTIMYMSSTFMFMFVLYIHMFVNLMGVGLGFIFLSYIIDYMREESSKSLILSGLFYFLLINTHLLTSFICFLCCVMLLVYYFNKERLKSYLRLALYIIIICSYYIANFLYHISALNDLGEINRFILGSDNTIRNKFSISLFPFEYLGKCILRIDNTGLCILDIIILAFMLVLFFKNRKSFSKKHKLLLLVGVFLLIFSLSPVWNWFNLEVYMLPFQFSFRYLPFLLIVMYCLILDKVKNKDLRTFMCSWSIFYLFIIMLVKISIHIPLYDKYESIGKYTGNGEYVTDRFICTQSEFELLSTRIIDEDNIFYKYTEQDGKLIFSVNTDKDTYLTLPKLYYKGYVAYLNNKDELRIDEGYSQFIKVYVPQGSNGTIYCYYKHPAWLILLDLFCLIIVFMSCINLIIIYKRKEKKQ